MGNGGLYDELESKTYIHAYTHTHAHIRTYKHPYMHAYIYVHRHIHVYIHLHSYIHANSHTYIHIHAHRHTTYVRTGIARMHTGTCIKDRHTHTYLPIYMHV